MVYPLIHNPQRPFRLCQVADRILQDEVAMAGQLLKLIPSITNEVMVTQGASAAAR